jgi:flagellin-like protein
MKKRAISPVVATVLLISLVLILAVIIYMWARAFLPEKMQKMDRPIEDVCQDVSFVAEYDAGIVRVRNEGNVPLNGVDIALKKTFGSEYLSGDFTATPSIKGGETKEFSIDTDQNPLNPGDNLLIVPSLLGRSQKDEQIKAFVCDESYGQTVTVQ